MRKAISKENQAKVDHAAEQLARLFIEQIKHKRSNKISLSNKNENSKD